jgi:hypothetical protein
MRTKSVMDDRPGGLADADIEIDTPHRLDLAVVGIRELPAA